MVCGNLTCLAKLALIVMIISFVCATIAIFTPYWSERELSNGKTEYTGLVVQCNNTLGVCSNLGDILDKYKDSSEYHLFVYLFVCSVNCIINYYFDPLPALPHSSVDRVNDLRTGRGRWFVSRLGKYLIRGLMIVIPLPRLSVVSTMVMLESSQWLGKNIVRSTG